MNRRQKIITIALWSIFLAAALVLVATWSAQRLNLITRPVAAGESPLFPIPEFALTDQENRPITLESLKGRPWVAAFIFTRCPGPCPRVTANMRQLQDKLPPAVQLVSFSLDAEYDTPEIFKAYADKFGADGSRWHFLTGDQTVIDHVAKEMNIAAQRGVNPIDIQHGTHLILVNANGKIQGYYAHDDADARANLVADAKALTH